VDRLASRGEPFQHLHVQVGERAARIHDQDQGGQLLAALDVIAQQLLPVQLGRARHLRVAISRQIDQQGLDLLDDGRVLAVLSDVRAADREVVDVLGASRRFRREGEALLVRQDINRRRFARVGATGKGDFGHPGGWEITQLVDGREEAGLPEFGHGREVKKATK